MIEKKKKSSGLRYIEEIKVAEWGYEALQNNAVKEMFFFVNKCKQQTKNSIAVFYYDKTII